MARIALLSFAFVVGAAVVAMTANAGSSNGLTQYTRPVPLGVVGGNAAINIDQVSGTCIGEFGTLGALVTNGATQYVLGTAHAFAVGTSGSLSYPAGSPIDQPYYGNATSPKPTCPPGLLTFTSLQVASLGTVVPITFLTTAQNTYDAALAPIIPGDVSSSMLNIPVFSGVPIAMAKRGTHIQ